MQYPEKRTDPRLNLKRLTIVSAVAWTMILTLILAWNLKELRRESSNIASYSAREQLLKYRMLFLWEMPLPADSTPESNGERSLIPSDSSTSRIAETSLSRHLALLPGREFIEKLKKDFPEPSGAKINIVSLNPLSADNTPDDWERKALNAFEGGKSMVSERATIGETEYLHLMMPIKIRRACLNCHEQEGYKPGDIKGGIGIFFPMASVLATERDEFYTYIVSFGLVWLLGISGIGAGAYRLRHRIDESQQAKKALRESEEMARALLNAPTESLLLLDIRGTIIDLNKTAAQMFGEETIDKLIGRSYYNLVSAETAETWKGYCLEVIQSGIPVRFEDEKKIKMFDVATFTAFFYSTIYPVFDAQGKVVRLAVFSRDMTGQKKSEEELNEEEKKYQALFENLNDAAFLAETGTGMIVEANKQAEVLLDRPREEIVGMHQTELHPPEQVDKYQEIFVKQVEKGNSVEFDCEIIRRNGETVSVMISAQTLTLGGKHFLLGIFRDLTLQKQMLERQIKASKLESIGVLSKGIAHDFNNILTSILGNISLANLYAEKKSQLSEILEKAEEASFRAKDLIQQLLSFSDGEAPVKKPTSIKDLLKQWAGLALRGSNVSCNFTIANELWTVEIDRGQIGQVINNLIINADQAMPEGGKIKLTAENIVLEPEEIVPLPGGKYIRISIEDHGPGISEDIQRRIFDPYFTTKENGVGLSLTTVHSILESHGGHISVESELNVGTTFHVYLPAS